MTEWKAQTALCMGFMLSSLSQRHPEFRHTWSLQNVRGSILPQLRQNLVDHALESKATHLLMIDSDMTFPQNLAFEWLKADRPVIAANCPTKTMPCWPTARQFGPGAGSVIYSEGAADRFERVWRVGTGIVMLRRDVLEKLPRPAFTPYWSEALDSYVFEDWVMMEHIEKLGFDIVVDHEMSQEVGHIGDYEFTHKHIGMTMRANAHAEAA